MSVDASTEVVVVGAGVEGLSVAWALASRGVSVTVVDRASVGSGFSSKSSGILRCHYGTPSLAAMSWRSLPTLENAPEVLGAEIGFHRTGYLVGVGADNVEPLEANVSMQIGLGIDVALIKPQDAAELMPEMRIDDFSAFAYEPRGGYADGYQTAQAFARAARLCGAQVRQGFAVVEIVVTGGAVTGGAVTGGAVTGVRSADGEVISAGTVVVAAGPWSAALLAPLRVDLPLRSQREQLMVVDPGQSIGPVPVLSDLVSLQYLRPEGSALLVGNSDHSEPEWADPDDYHDGIDEEFLLGAVDKFAHRFPGIVSPGLRSSYAGCYDVTPDYNPVIGGCSVEGLIICAGFSGHGFKISPAVGTLVADLICDGRSNDPLVADADFALERFDQGRLLASLHPYAGAGEMR